MRSRFILIMVLLLTGCLEQDERSVSIRSPERIEQGPKVVRQTVMGQIIRRKKSADGFGAISIPNWYLFVSYDGMVIRLEVPQSQFMNHKIGNEIPICLEEHRREGGWDRKLKAECDD